jgi:hypothetical protein
VGRTGFLLDEELEWKVLRLAVGTRRTQAVLRVTIDDGLEREEGTKVSGEAGNGGLDVGAYVVASALAEAAAPRVVSRLEPRPLRSRVRPVQGQ